MIETKTQKDTEDDETISNCVETEEALRSYKKSAFDEIYPDVDYGTIIDMEFIDHSEYNIYPNYEKNPNHPDVRCSQYDINELYDIKYAEKYIKLSIDLKSVDREAYLIIPITKTEYSINKLLNKTDSENLANTLYDEIKVRRLSKRLDINDHRLYSLYHQI